ncbi:MAG: TraB/GumN family protein [Oscillospiraceae bacterium]|nr:TraB/GumN family protein [Oscillospiraceae bacterium]
MTVSRRLGAFLLCFCLLAGLLSGCKTDPQKQEASSAPNTTASEPVTVPVTTTETVPATTEAPVDYVAEYLAARAALEGESALTIVTELSQTVTLADETVTEHQTETAQYQDRGGENPIVVSTRDLRLDSGNYNMEQVYSAETLYSKVGDSKFRAPETEENFLSLQTPLTLLDPANYETLTLEGDTIRFTGALAGEEWALPKGAELVEAEGTATLENGALTAQTYAVTFQYAGTEIARTYTSTLRVGTEGDLSARVPAQDEEAVELESSEAILLLLRAEAAMDHLHMISFNINSTDFSQAAATVMTQREQMHFYGQNRDMCFSSSLSGGYTDYSEDISENFSFETSLVDGVYSSQSNDDPPEETKLGAGERIQVAKMYLDGMRAVVTEDIPKLSDLTSAVVYDIGDYYYMEYSCGEDFARAMDKKACYNLFSDKEMLMNLAESYEVESMSGYLAIEKHTWLPTSVGVLYTAAHTIEGNPYTIVRNEWIGISMGDPDTYEEITGEPLPDVEPAEKANPVFYEVTDENGAKLWLFGTIHVGDDRTAFLPQAIYDAFDASDALAVEFDDAAFEEEIENDPELLKKVAEAYYYTDDTTIEDHLEEDVYEAALRYMKVTGSFSAQTEMMRPFVWENEIQNFYRSQGRRLTSSKGVDHRLMTRAREQEKKILDVESGEAQLGMMAGYSDKLQQLLLEEAMKTPRWEYLEGIYELYDLWCGGDEAALIEELAAADEEELSKLTEEERALYEEYHTAMETSRNTDMLAVAKGYLESGETVFFAVGLAHLLGDGGLVQALRDAGYTVTLIQN